ncbi:MAG TPA: c-type cytochrome, partial [Planctomycetota bacterium]|nr:c-type cytochrome [Planctomycetota bacterium]
APAEAVSAAPGRAFVKMWTLAELDGDAKELSGRSFARGKEMFTAAGCIKCHVMGGEGAKIGPDLAKVSEKYKGEKLLRQIIEPSTEINEQFKTWLIQTADGDVVTGLVLKEDADALHVMTNLLKPAEVTLLPKSKVQARKVAELSLMPTGMLVTLTKDEILDLVAYMESGGDANHRLFKE